MRFIDLNQDVISMISKFLSGKDIYAISVTCKNIRNDMKSFYPMKLLQLYNLEYHNSIDKDFVKEHLCDLPDELFIYIKEESVFFEEKYIDYKEYYELNIENFSIFIKIYETILLSEINISYKEYISLYYKIIERKTKITSKYSDYLHYLKYSYYDYIKI